MRLFRRGYAYFRRLRDAGASRHASSPDEWLRRHYAAFHIERYAFHIFYLFFPQQLFISLFKMRLGLPLTCLPFFHATSRRRPS